LVVIAVVGAGYLSNALTYRECERQVARWLSQDVMRGHEFTVLGDDDTPYLRKLLDSVGARYRVDKAQPWGEIRPASMAIPFLVTVEYGWVFEDGIGEGGSRRFLCLFGIAIELGESVHWVT
jgi:hypothetical protein